MAQHSNSPLPGRDDILRARDIAPARKSAFLAVALGVAAGLVSGCALLDLPPEPPEPPVTAAALEPLPVPPTNVYREPRRTRKAIALDELPIIAPVDLLERLRLAFVLPGNDDISVSNERNWFASHPEYLDRVFNRSQKYLFYIAESLQERGMPTDLALLPIVESAFDPFAYSHGRASGLWQIIPGTGRRLGLKQNWWYDGRRDVIDSTRAALDYLEKLHEQFDGDWLLAVAGYNSGEGNVARAIKRAKAAGQSTDFWGIRRYLPKETRTYVPRLLAIRDLVAAPAEHELELPLIEDLPFFTVVETRTQIDMALAAEFAGIDIDELYALNPGVNRWATDPDGPHRIAVPIERATQFSAALTDLGEREHVQWTRHQVRPGETLSHLAIEYQTTEAVLREINELRGNMIRVGDYLMIPRALASLNDYTQSLDERAERQKNRDREGQRQVHVVAAGDSFWTISRRYKVGVRELANWNAMAPGDVLNIGRELVVWTSEPVLAVALNGQSQDQIRRVNYVVRRGDSLSSIAGRFRITVNKLLEWNSISQNKYLQPGQRLVMYVDVTEQSS
jgi:membrane-bound lytic murein transglycosylase D